MRLLRDDGQATNRPRTQHTLVNLGQNCKRIMQPVTSTAVPRTITVCSCFAVGFVLNIVIMMKMTRPCSESPCSGVDQVDPARLLDGEREHQVLDPHVRHIRRAWRFGGRWPFLKLWRSKISGCVFWAAQMGIVEINICQEGQIELGDLVEHFFLYGRPWWTWSSRQICRRSHWLNTGTRKCPRIYAHMTEGWDT